MSSNIRVNRICQFCNKEFIAKTTVTKYSSDNCAKRAYKKRLLEEKVHKSDTETTNTILKPLILLQNKEFLTINEVSQLVGVSRDTINSMIEQRKVKSAKFGRRIIILRKDLESIFT